MIGKRFYFMRHGETVSNSEGLMAGSTDTPLTEKGREQARATRSIVTNLPITKIYHSPLTRAHDTALLANELKQTVLHPHDDLKEWHMGDWEGDPFQVVRNRLSQGLDPMNGETKQDFHKRTHDALHNLLQIEQSPFLVVAHGGVFSAWRKRLPLQTDIRNVHNCMVIEVYNDQGGWYAFEVESSSTR
jgi:broad specificity phosphatase PhoE